MFRALCTLVTASLSFLPSCGEHEADGGPPGSSTLPVPGGPAPAPSGPSAPNARGPGACSDLYDPGSFPTFEVEMSAAEWEGLAQDCNDGAKEYRPIVFRYGEEVVDAMLRLKGNWSWSCDKMQFVISFNEVDPDGRFHGLRKLVLDAPWYDPTLLHERLAFHFLERYGTPSSCVNNARLLVNGELYGVYANVERIDREYLERHFDDPSGNLWKEGLELTTNEATGSPAMIDAFWASDDANELATLVDLDAAVTLWAGLAMLPDPDSYWAGVEINFYLYEHPTRGLVFLPYDTDIAFAEDLWPGLENFDPITHEHDEWLREAQYRAILSDPAQCAAFEAALERASETYQPALMVQKLEEWDAQIRAAVAEDPRLPFTLDERAAALAELRTFPERRQRFIDEWLSQGSHCPISWPSRSR